MRSIDKTGKEILAKKAVLVTYEELSNEISYNIGQQNFLTNLFLTNRSTAKISLSSVQEVGRFM